MSALQCSSSSTEQGAARNERSRRPPFPANLCLPIITPQALNLTSAQNGYWAFNKLKRENGKVDCNEVDGAREQWEQGILTRSEFEREKELASIWNTGLAITHSTGSNIPCFPPIEPSATTQPNSAVLGPSTQPNSVTTPLTSQPTSAPHPAVLSPTTQTESSTNVSSSTAIETVTVKSAATYFKAKSLLLIDYAFYASLENQLYANRLVPPEASPLYEKLRKVATRFVFLIILRMEELGDVLTDRPISHVFVDIIACVEFLRKTAALDWKDQIDHTNEHRKFSKLRKSFWKRKFANADRKWTADHWKEYWTYLDPQIKLILYQIRNLLLLDPDDHFPGCFLQRTFQSKDISQQSQEFLPLSPDHPLIRRTRLDSFRGDLLKRAGIRMEEVNPKNEFWLGSLSDVNDRDICTGPFRLALTDDPHLHLRFNGNKVKPTILILDSCTVSILAILDLTDLMKQIGLPGYLTEMLASQSLIFSTEKSQEIVKAINDKDYEIDLQILQDFRESRGLPEELWDLPIFGSRLRRVYQKMIDWRPLRVRQLWHRPYRDPLAYFAAWFAVTVGVLTVLALLASVAQLIVAILTWKSAGPPGGSK